MTADNDNPIQSQGLYVWQRDNLLAATQTLDGRWQAADGHAPVEKPSDNGSATRTEPTMDKADFSSQRIATDTRSMQVGDIFLAISGDNFEGHDYIEQAAIKGAVAVIVSHPITTHHASTIPQLVVSDTRLALGQLAAYRRAQHPNLSVIALTGSSGKTTCKEMLGSIFSRLAPTLITRGNLNNDFGVPMTLLEISDQHRYAILELGANHSGEIAYTAQLVRPDVACVLNVGTAHLGEFGSRDIICQTKAEIYQTLTAEQVAIVPECDDFSHELYQIAQTHCTKVIGFGATDVRASHLIIEPESSQFKLHIGDTVHDVHLPLAGEHNVNNALAAAACAQALQVAVEDIVIGLEKARPAKGRLNTHVLGHHRFIDDTYNANPHSVRAAATVLAAQSGTKIMVLGDISELGDAAVSEHHSLGRTIGASGIDRLLCVGEYAADSVAGVHQVHAEMNTDVDKSAPSPTEAQAFADKASLLAYLQPYLQANQQIPCTVLFKGSRSMQMETLINALVEE